jgi:heptosyltransferase-1
LQESINLLFTNRRIPLRRQDKYVSDNYLRLVSVPFGRDYTGMSLTTELPSSLADETCAQAFLATLADGLVFLFQIGTTWETKFWHEEGWIALGVGIHDLYPEATIVINWGNATEKGTGERLAAAVGGNIRLLPWMSIGELIALLKKVDLVVGGDTGPVHIAAAVGTPTVSFYRATDGQVLGPRGNDHVRIQAQMGCTACYRTRCDKDAECRRSVRVEAIQAGIKKLLGEGLEN